MGPLLLVALAGANPSWPARDPDLPAAELLQAANMPDDPGFAPGPECLGQIDLLSALPSCLPAIGPEERARQIGSGIHADRAWLYTIGRPEVAIAVLGSGADPSDPELVGRWRLNAGELAAPDLGDGSSSYDRNGDGAFTVLDYTSATGTSAPTLDRVLDRRLLARPDRGDSNANGLLDPIDLLAVFGDGVDDDANGFSDDVAGWDFLNGDADPSDPSGRRGDGPVLLRAIAASANDGRGGAGVCPACGVLPLRVGERGLAMAEPLSAALAYATSAKSAVAAVAVAVPFGAPGLSAARDQAQAMGMLIVASSPDRGRGVSLPLSGDQVLFVGGVGLDRASASQATSTLFPDGCAGFGPQLSLVAPNRCDDRALALTAGAAGLLYSAALGVPSKNVPPLAQGLAPEEARQLLVKSADDITDPASLSQVGFDERTGAGRVNARSAIDALIARRLPPKLSFAGPADRSIHDPSRGAPIPIAGQVEWRRGLQASWRLEYALGLQPEASAYRTLATGVVSGQAVTASADLPISGLSADPTAPPEAPGDHWISLRLSAVARGPGPMTSSEVRHVIAVHHDLDLLPGFPIELGPGAVGVRIADRDSDGRAELLLAAGDGEMRVFGPDGRALPDFSLHAPEAWAWPPTLLLPFESPSGALRLAALTTSGTLFVTDVHGLPLFEPLHLAGSSTVGGVRYAPPAIADLDGDGSFELVLVQSDGTVRALVLESGVERFRTRLAPGLGAPAIGDLDGDGRAEIVVANQDTLFLLYGDGSARPESPIQLPARETTGRAVGLSALLGPSPALADADGDGRLDVLLATRGRPTLMFSAAALDTARPLSAGSAPAELYGASEQVVAADLNDDDRFEVLTTLLDAEALRGDPGNLSAPVIASYDLANDALAEGFPRAAFDPSPLDPAVADVDGDHRPELLVAGTGRIEAFAFDGSRPTAWPKLIAGSALCTPAIGDLDGDGLLEIAAVTREGGLYVWRTRGKASDRIHWGGFRHDHRATGNVSNATLARVGEAARGECACNSSSGGGRSALFLLVLIALTYIGRPRSSRPE